MTEINKFLCDDHDKYRNELRMQVSDFLAKNAVSYIIGISGDAEKGKEKQTRSIIEQLIDDSTDIDYAILTGGTEGGVPQIGTKVAKEYNVPRIGVFPKQGAKYALLDDLDLAIETTLPDYGDGVFGTETPTFSNLLDGSAIIGGSYGTLIEIATIFKTTIKRLKAGEAPVYVAPVSGTGGVADYVHELAHKHGRGVEKSLPSTPLTNGSEIASFLRSSLQKSPARRIRANHA